MVGRSTSGVMSASDVVSLGDVELAVAGDGVASPAVGKTTTGDDVATDGGLVDPRLAAVNTAASAQKQLTPRVGGARYSVGTPPTSKSRLFSAVSPSSTGALLAATGTMGGATDLAGIFSACREATHELEHAVRAAVSHREKCAVVLGAALAVNIALAEADAVSPALDAFTQTQLKRLCSGILSTLGLAVARVQVYGQYSRAQKILRILWYRATESKFDELRKDLETLEAQLWNLTGAVGGLGAGGTTAAGYAASASKRRSGNMKKLSAGPDRPRRMLRGGASHWIMGGDVRVMCAAGVDGTELWWASNRSATLSAYDLFLQSHRNVATLSGPEAVEGRSAAKRKNSCMGVCLGDVTAIAAEEGSALLWTGTDWGGVATWDTDVACQWGGTAVVSPKGAAVTAITPVDRGVAWAALSDGALVELEAAENPEESTRQRRELCAAGERPVAAARPANCSGDDAQGWGGANGKKRAAGAAARELLRLGPLVWASADDMVLEAWDVDAAACVSLSPHRDLGPCVAVVPHAAAGQVVTVHATGAVQLWWAMDEVSANSELSANSGGSSGGRRLGTRAERLAGPSPAGGAVVGAAVVDRLLCVGHRSGALKVLVLPGWGSDDANAAGASFRAGGGGAQPVPAKIKAHRSGMVLLRAVDGGGHVGVATTGFFGSMIFWPLAELEAAVAAAQPPSAREAPRSGVSSSGTTRRALAQQLPLPLGGDADARFSDATDGSRDVGDSLPTPGSLKNTGGVSSQASSLAQNTALIPFKEIRLKKCIGEGSFGRVYVAVWANHTEVAVKMLGPPSSFAGKEDPLEKQRGRRMAVGATAAKAENAANAGGGNGDGVARVGARSDDSDDEMAREGEDAAAAEVLDELEKEVGIMARLRHPNIVLLLGAVRSPPAIVEEFCARGSLFSVLQRHTKPGVPPLEWRVRLQMALGAAAGMCYLHNCAPPIIHRDLKSPNLMVDRYFRVKVGDFNLSRVAVASVGSKAGAGGASPEFSVGGLHSPRWMAPEVLQSAAYTRASDVYSFAVVLWELRSLQVPWAQVGQWQVMHAVVEEGQRPDLDEVPTPTFSSLSQYDALIRDGWAQESSERPAFEEIITRLQGIIDAHAASSSTSSGGRTRSGSSRGDSRAAPPAAPPKSPPRSPKRHSRPGSPVKTHSPPKLGAKRTPVEDGAVRDHGAIAVALAEAPAEVGVEAHDEAEQTLNRILTRKRSTKLDAAAVPKSVAAATDAAVGELRASREWASPMKRKPPARAPPTAAAAAASAAAAAAGAAVAAAEVEATLSKPKLSGGQSLARFQSFLQASRAFTAAGADRAKATQADPDPEPTLRHSRSRSEGVRQSAHAVLQSPPRDSPARLPPPTPGHLAHIPSTMSPMIRAIAARKTLEPLDLEPRMHRRTRTTS